MFQIVLAGTALPDAHAQEPRGRYIVVLKKGTNASATAIEHGRRYGVLERAVYSHAIDGYSADVPESRVSDLRSDPLVASVFPDVAARAAAQTTPTGVSRIRAPLSLDKGTGVNVAVLDTGIDLDHPDLAANIVGGKNCSDGSSYNDTSTSGHGTHVAGIIAALDNSIGVRGVAPEAKLWAVRVLDNSGSGDYSSLICGLDFVDAKSPAHGGPIAVANMSIEASPVSDDGNCGNTNGDALHQAICRVVADGVTLTVAAGNDGSDLRNTVPATYGEVITATSMSDSDGAPCGLGSAASFGGDDTFSSFSNYATLSSDASHVMGAPGDDINSTLNDGGYGLMSGTSMASPHIAGAAALYIAEHPGSTPAGVLAGLKAAGEAASVNFGGECTAGFSHTDPSQKHPEVVVAVKSAAFVVQPPANATASIGVMFAGPVSGVDDTNVVLRLASGGSNMPATVAYDAPSHKAFLQPSSALTPGEHYSIVVAPQGSTPITDGNGQQLPESTVGFRGGLVEEEGSAVAGFAWRTVTTSAAYGGSFILDRTRGAWAMLTFIGTSISWYTELGPDQGNVSVVIDGVNRGTFDNYRASALYRYRRSWGLPAGTHTIRIVAAGKDELARDAYVGVDAFGVNGTLIPSPAPKVVWRVSASSLASRGLFAEDSSIGARVGFRFRGTGIDWRTLLGPDQGVANVSIDGVFKGSFDNYAIRAAGYTRSFRGLSDAVHTITIVIAGSKRAVSSDTNVSVDYWRVI